MLSSLLEIDIASRNLTPKAAVSQLPKTAAQRIQTIARNYSRLNATTFHPTRNIPHLFPQQDVKKVVEQLYRSGRLASVTHRRVPRPWGSYESIDAGDRFQVKRIIIAPGAQLSLQMHHHRAEHWIVVKGTGLVTNGDAEIILTENQSTYIPPRHPTSAKKPRQDFARTDRSPVWLVSRRGRHRPIRRHLRPRSVVTATFPGSRRTRP